jgi:hypothetical protein
MPDSKEEQSQQIISGLVVAADHRPREPLTAFVAPTVSDDFNTIRERLIPKGCFRLEDVVFEFDSSFVRPEVAKEMRYLADLREKHKEGDDMPPLSVFGHGDPVGMDDYNKQLSGRRATAVYAMLVRDVDLWEQLYTQPLGGDKWGNPSIETMLTALDRLPETGGENSAGQTQDAVQAFQAEKGLAADGVVGPNTRKALYRDYMDLICGPRLLLEKEKDFLARHKDAGGKGDYQGCGEFNPVRMFSQEENARYEKAKDKTERNEENEPNRRVMILLFAPRRRVEPQFWPCPRVKEGTSACKKRFFPDADKRRSFQEDRREFNKTHDTYACRFYQLITDDSPCERFLASFSIRLYDLAGRFIALAPCRLTVGSRQSMALQANERGILTALDVEVPNRCHIEWGLKPQGGEEPDYVFSLHMFLSHDDLDKEDEAKQKLHNLGYPEDNELNANVRSFQEDYGHLATPPLQADGELDDRTMDLIRGVYRDSADDLRNTPPQ